jgi:trehalose 6-phosphate synthase
MTRAKEDASARPSGRLVAISNRTAAGSESKAGGLAVALWETLVETKGLWIGWSGRVLDFETARVNHLEEEGVQFALSDLSRRQYDGFYLAYANSVLWPVMHNRIDLAVFEADTYRNYRSVNEKFARIAVQEARADDFVWVHDYHFFLLGRMMRQRGWKGRLGWFLHIPFPAPDAFRAIPQHRELGEAMCAYDVVGVQTSKDLYNLARYLEEEFDAEELPDGRFRVGERTVRLLHCPIGIDVDAFVEAATCDHAKQAAAKLETFLGNRQLVLGVDRMDYSKGLIQRFEGMADLFDRHPDVHGQISFTQIAPPSRSVVEGYQLLRQKLDELSGRINGDYGDLDWIPIRYLARGYDRDEIAGLYRLAKVCLVTPLQDGMNLVAKEFIAAQDPEDPGVLVLSQFAGAAEQMQEALIVNPYDAVAIAEAVYRAIHMPLEERKIRWASLMDGINRQDLIWWRNRFLDAVPADAEVPAL